jgi:hypothetical protein
LSSRALLSFFARCLFTELVFDLRRHRGFENIIARWSVLAAHRNITTQKCPVDKERVTFGEFSPRELKMVSSGEIDNRKKAPKEKRPADAVSLQEKPTSYDLRTLSDQFFSRERTGLDYWKLTSREENRRGAARNDILFTRTKFESQAHTVSSGDLAPLTLTSLFFVGFAWREELYSLIFLFRGPFHLEFS